MIKVKELLNNIKRVREGESDFSLLLDGLTESSISSRGSDLIAAQNGQLFND